MFTEEEKIRAIELYFTYGKKLAPVVRELGYPSKRNLRRWIRSWEAGGGAKESIRHKPRYTDEQNINIPRLIQAGKIILSTKLLFSCLRRVHREYNNSESYLRERLFICSYLILLLARL